MKKMMFTPAEIAAFKVMARLSKKSVAAGKHRKAAKKRKR